MQEAKMQDARCRQLGIYRVGCTAGAGGSCSHVMHLLMTLQDKESLLIRLNPVPVVLNTPICRALGACLRDSSLISDIILH